jgi:Ca2+-binding EF-hand superfamily protein
LERSVALEIARAWRPNRSSAIKHLFEEIDADFSGKLDKNQVGLLFKQLGMREKSAKSAANAMDLSREGRVSWTEFVAACVDLANDDMLKDLQMVFKKADHDRDGLLTQEDLAQLVGAQNLHALGVPQHIRHVNWATFQEYVRGSRVPETGVQATLGLKSAHCEEDFWINFWKELDQACKTIMGPQANPGDALQALVDMGFTNVNVCMAVLKDYNHNLASPGFFTDLRKRIEATHEPTGTCTGTSATGHTPTRRR